jgi:hypothetical protein
MPPRQIHESRFREFCRLDGLGDRDFNVTIATRNLQADLMKQFASEPRSFGLLAPRLVNRVVIAEHCSSPPRPRETDRMVVKLLAVLEQWRSESSESNPPPLLLVLCRAGIGAWRSRLPDAKVGDDGIIESGILAPAQVVIVDGRALPRLPGYAALRFMLRPEGDEFDYLAELLGDATLPMEFRQRVVEAAMNQQIPITEPERMTAAERVRREGMLEGLREGERRGERRGERKGERRGSRSALLRLAAATLGEPIATELGALKDPAAIEAELVRRLRERA